MMVERKGIMRMLMSVAFFISCSSLFTSPTVAQCMLTERYNMACLDLGVGLPHNHVNHIFADSQGFIWISTYGGGAVRYDGYTFMTPMLNRRVAAVSNSCKGFAEDAFHRLWIAFDEGTVVLDLRTMNSTTPSLTSIAAQLRQPTVKVYSDSKGGLWQMTRDSVFRYTFRNDGSVAHVSRCLYHGNTPDITVNDIEHNGTVWINIEGGLYHLSESNGKLIRREIASAMRQLHGLYVTNLLKHGNTVWISTNHGLFAYNLYTGGMKAYYHTTDTGSLSHDCATSLAITPEGRLLVGTLRGVNILDEASDTFQHWNSTTTGKPMPSDFVHCMLLYDNQIWIGTETAGVIRLSPQPLLLRNYAHSPSDSRSLSPNPVNAMYVEPDGTLWAGTVEGGLNRMDDSGGFIHWTQANSRLPHNSVSVLEPDVHGRLWIGTWGGGVASIQLKDHATITPIEVPTDMVALTSYIGSLAYDKYNDALWIGSNDGIFYYDLQTGRLSDPFRENRLIRGCVGSLVDKEGHLWMGCLSGVCVIDLRSGSSEGGKFKYRHLSHKLDQPESPVIDKISCFCEGKDGTLWLGSNGYGLYRRVVDAKSGQEHFESLTTDDGLANNAVKGIVEDRQGRLWITTDNGLSVYNPSTRSFTNYDENDGLLCQRFYWNSAVKGHTDVIYLGSQSGLTEIRGENMDALYPLRLTFTRLMVDHQEITSANSDYIDADISQATRIKLHESNKSFSIDFSTLTYAGETQGHYSYRMHGLEDEWIPLKPGEHSVRYSALPSGSYTFEVRYVPLADDVEEQILSLEIDVSPYFWKSWWFLMLLVLLVSAIAIYVYKRRVEELKRREAEKLLNPIRKVLEESDNPSHLQTRIKNILDNHERLRESMNKNVEADKQALLLQKPFMDRVMELMELNYEDSEFGVTEFCEAIGMSRSVVSKRLNEETGQSTGRFIRGYRLNIAKELLMKNQGNRNITEIAYKVGFNDPKYFTRCFTKLFGVNPSTFIDESMTDN